MKRYPLPRLGSLPAFFISLCALALSACGPIPDTDPNVLIMTELGEIEVNVLLRDAPASAGDFLRYVDEGLYDGQSFYRVVTAETDPRGMGMSLIQGGRTDQEPIHPPVAHERTDETKLSNISGTVSLARNEPGTGSAAWFFINIGDNAFLDSGPGTRNPDEAGYAVFGEVVRGMDVVRAIQAQPANGQSEMDVTQGQILSDPIEIISAKRVD